MNERGGPLEHVFTFGRFFSCTIMKINFLKLLKGKFKRLRAIGRYLREKRVNPISSAPRGLSNILFLNILWSENFRSSAFLHVHSSTWICRTGSCSCGKEIRRLDSCLHD